MEDIGSVHFRLRHPNKPDQVQLVRADVQVDGPSIFVYLYRADQWPFMIENDSDYPLSFSQVDRRHEAEGSQPSKPLPVYNLAAKTSTNYAWDQPAARDKAIQLRINDARRNVDVLEIGDLVPFKFPVCPGNSDSPPSYIYHRFKAVIVQSLWTSGQKDSNRFSESRTTVQSEVYTSQRGAALVV
jgi:hypothetical protein